MLFPFIYKDFHIVCIRRNCIRIVNFIFMLDMYLTMYEQRNKDKNKAQAITVIKIAHVLGCEVEDLIEPGHSIGEES